jgi:hypothetical protein
MPTGLSGAQQYRAIEDRIVHTKRHTRQDRVMLGEWLHEPSTQNLAGTDIVLANNDTLINTKLTSSTQRRAVK